MIFQPPATGAPLEDSFSGSRAPGPIQDSFSVGAQGWLQLGPGPEPDSGLGFCRSAFGLSLKNNEFYESAAAPRRLIELIILK